MMFELGIGFAVAAVILFAEHLLCTRLKSPLWGGILPLGVLVGTIFILTSGRVPLTLQTIFPLVIANTVIWGDWAVGRENYKKRQQAELEKMKAKDITP